MSDEARRFMFGQGFCTQLETLLAWRRDVRRFHRDSLPEGAIDNLIATAALAPSVGNAQPWRFVRVTSSDTRESLAAHADMTSERAAQRYGPARARVYRALKLHGLREAPAILAIFSDDATAAGHGLGSATMPEMLRYSTVMAIHTLWLSARAQGIGVGWVSIVEPTKVATLLDVPKQWTLIAILCIGYPERTSTKPELQTNGWQDRLAPVVIER